MIMINNINSDDRDFDYVDDNPATSDRDDSFDDRRKRRSHLEAYRPIPKGREITASDERAKKKAIKKRRAKKGYR